MNYRPPFQFFALLLISAILMFATVPCLQAQVSTNAPPANAGSFFSTVTGYFTAFNPDLTNTFSGKGTVFTSVDSIQGGAVPLANSLGLSYRLFGPVEAENVLRTSGIAGTVLSDQAGLNLGFQIIDTKLSLYADAGYDIASKTSSTKDQVYGEFGLRVFKALTSHTFGGVGIGVQVPNNAQVFSAYVGFTF